MLGQRYYIYLFYINALVSVTAFIPQILYKNRFNGSLTSLVLSTIAGIILISVFQTQIKIFPGKSLSDILNGLFQGSLQKGILFLYFILSIVSGTLFLNSIMKIIEKFLFLNSNMIFYSILTLIVFSIMIETISILYMLEIILLFVTPFLLLILFRFFTDNLVWVDSISQSMTYLMHLPKLNSVVSGLFVFTGFTNLLVYYEYIRPFNRKQLIIILGIIWFVLFSLYFIPIGYFGLNGVENEKYVWITTIDSMRIDYFFLERIVLLFILVLVGITLMYIILSYHSSLKFFQLITGDAGGKLKWIVIAIVVISGIITQQFVDDFSLIKFFNYFFILRIILDLTIIFILLYASRRQQT